MRERRKKTVRWAKQINSFKCSINLLIGEVREQCGKYLSNKEAHKTNKNLILQAKSWLRMKSSSAARKWKANVIDGFRERILKFDYSAAISSFIWNFSDAANANLDEIFYEKVRQFYRQDQEIYSPTQKQVNKLYTIETKHYVGMGLYWACSSHCLCVCVAIQCTSTHRLYKIYASATA